MILTSFQRVGTCTGIQHTIRRPTKKFSWGSVCLFLSFFGVFFSARLLQIARQLPHLGQGSSRPTLSPHTYTVPEGSNQCRASNPFQPTYYSSRCGVSNVKCHCTDETQKLKTNWSYLNLSSNCPRILTQSWNGFPENISWPRNDLSQRQQAV